MQGSRCKAPAAATRDQRTSRPSLLAMTSWLLCVPLIASHQGP
jgi:hypothetical protein